MGWRGSGQQSAKHFRGGSETLNLVVVLDSLLYRGFDWLAVERTVEPARGGRYGSDLVTANTVRSPTVNFDRTSVYHKLDYSLLRFSHSANILQCVSTHSNEEPLN